MFLLAPNRHQLPFSHLGLKDQGTRYRYRKHYLDLISGNTPKFSLSPQILVCGWQYHQSFPMTSTGPPSPYPA
ncbi:hypothetical protein EV361DRAFT_915024 [Lentinula raphanica]|nr:hypothetical protein EV361DRAFT_915024 [Lentinula raphanica]